MLGPQVRDKVMQVKRETDGKPEERERRLKELAKEHAIAGGVVCKCDDKNAKICPTHGRIRY